MRCRTCVTHAGIGRGMTYLTVEWHVNIRGEIMEKRMLKIRLRRWKGRDYMIFNT